CESGRRVSSRCWWDVSDRRAGGTSDGWPTRGEAVNASRRCGSGRLLGSPCGQTPRPRRRHRRPASFSLESAPVVGRTEITLLAASAMLSGCTALGVSVAGLGGAVVGAGTGAVVKAGTEYELGGTVARTFPVPLAELRQAAIDTFERL